MQQFTNPVRPSQAELVAQAGGCCPSDIYSIDPAFEEKPGALALMRLAVLQVRLWEAATETQVQELRREERRNGVHRAMQLQRCAGEMLRALFVKHMSLGTFFAPVATRPRWQRWLTFSTTVLAVFTITIWLYREKAVNCCLEVRDLLGCSADIREPCLGFSGDCADLVPQFGDVGGTRLPYGYSCKQFPNERSAVHLVYAGLIAAAIVLPFGAIIDGLFIEGNQPEFPELQLTLPGWMRALGGQSAGWHFRVRFHFPLLHGCMLPSPVAALACVFDVTSAHRGSTAPPPPPPVRRPSGRGCLGTCSCGSAPTW